MFALGATVALASAAATPTAAELSVAERQRLDGGAVIVRTRAVAGAGSLVAYTSRVDPGRLVDTEPATVVALVAGLSTIVAD